MAGNPLDGFEIDRSRLRYIGSDLQRPECILAERDGTLWSADARGGVVRLGPDGSQRIITQQRSDGFAAASSEASRYLEGTLPNGLAFAENGDILISNFGTDCLEVMTRDGATRVLADSIDGEAISATDISRDTKAASSASWPTASASRTRSASMRRKSFCMWSKPPAVVSRACASAKTANRS